MSLNYTELLLPRIPQEITDFILAEGNKRDPSTYSVERAPQDSYTDMYEWFALPPEFITWFRANISPNRYFGVQVIKKNLPIHRDYGSNVKFNYLVQAGNTGVETVFYNDDMVENEAIVLEEHKWYILSVQELHNIRGLIDGNYRLGITSRIAKNNRI